MPENDLKTRQIRAYYDTLVAASGRQHWWPAHSRFEVVVGAYLTQNTAWTNVEKAMLSLRRARLLSLRGIRETPIPKLEKLIRSAGYFRQKARRLKTFVRFLDQTYDGSFTRMFAQPTAKIREELLALNGVGPETADSILLYAGNHPIFVVDAYTRRVLERHQIASPTEGYDAIRKLVEDALATAAIAPAALPGNVPAPAGTSHRPSRMSAAPRRAQVQVLNEMHALIVGVGKNHCLKSQTRCEQCPLQKFLPRKS